MSSSTALQAAAATFAGQVEQLKNSFNNLQEEIGREAIPVLQTWMVWMKTAVEWTQKLFDANRADLTVREAALSKNKEELESLRNTNTARVFGFQITEKNKLELLKEIQAKERLISQIEKEIKAENDLAKNKGGKDEAKGGGSSVIDEELDRKSV